MLFLDASGGTNSPVQPALNSTFSNNNISGNWYGQIVDRQAGGSLPAPGTTNLKNFSGNWFGTNAPVVTTANSAEPGYAAQIPVAFGGTATPPGGQPDIAGPASANFDYTPFLWTGTDTSPTMGFQGDFSQLGVTNDGSQTQSSGRIQEAIDAAPADGTVHVLAGTYNEDVDVNKPGSCSGRRCRLDNHQRPDRRRVRHGPGHRRSAWSSTASRITRAGNNTTDWNNPGLNTRRRRHPGPDDQRRGPEQRLRRQPHRHRRQQLQRPLDPQQRDRQQPHRADLPQPDRQHDVTENQITNNWTVGVLFLDASGGTNARCSRRRTRPSPTTTSAATGTARSSTGRPADRCRRRART